MFYAKGQVKLAGPREDIFKRPNINLACVLGKEIKVADPG